MPEVSFDLSGRVAIVTGGSRGIGEAIARAFAKAGAKVVITGRKMDALERAVAVIAADGGEASAISCHMGDMVQVKDLVAKTVEKYGTVDILVNNAATNPYFGPLINADERAWDKIMEVNLKGAFFLAQEAAKVMIGKGGGSIVNLASVAGYSPGPMQGIYSMSKAGVIAMTKAMAKELALQKVRVNAVAPGLTETNFSALLINTKEILDYALQGIPMKRYAQPSEIVGAVLFLASDAASYVTGTVITVDGGSLA